MKKKLPWFSIFSLYLTKIITLNTFMSHIVVYKIISNTLLHIISNKINHILLTVKKLSEKISYIFLNFIYRCNELLYKILKTFFIDYENKEN